ncbi:MAG: hypothetical protein ACOVQ5_04210 [Flavobacteriales bacterium]|jgi:hypothetical protein
MKSTISIIFIFLLFACNNSETKNSNVKTPAVDTAEVVNAPLGAPAGEGVFQASGIVGVFFEPSKQARLDRIKKGEANVEKTIADFKVWKSKVELILKDRGISFYSTDKDRLMLEVSNKSRKTVNLFALPNPCGLILTAQGKDHLIINENLSGDELEVQLKAFYGK